MSGSGRVAGHELQREGAPYVKKGNRTHLVNPGSWSTKADGLTGFSGQALVKA